MTADSDLIVCATITAGTLNANPLPEHPQGWRVKDVWTIRNQARFEQIGLVHGVTAHLEDINHDYKIRNGCLHYFSRIYDPGEQARVAIVFEPEPVLKKRTRKRVAP